MASTTRRLAPMRTKQRVNPSADQLADKLSSLTISKPKSKGKEKATPTPEEQRVSAMRAVNAASQELSAAVQSGWRKSSDLPPTKRSPTFVSASASASQAAKQLALLREISPGDVDIERAAGSVLGKLVALEMFDAALLALQEMHPRLCTLLQVVPPMKSVDHLYLLSIPRPESSPGPILLTLGTTFLLHALTTISHLITTPTSKSPVTSFTQALTDTPTILAWTSLLLTLPPAHTDSVLTRAYNSLIKLASALQGKPKIHRQVFLLRDYALSCLAHTAPGKIEPRSFWDQCVKSAGAYVRALGSSPEDHDEATPIVLNVFAQIIARVETRTEAGSFMSGKGFVSFCECWMSFAIRNGDIATLDRIAIFIGSQPEISRKPVSEETTKTGAPNEILLECAQLCTSLAQTTTLLDPKEEKADSAGLNKRLRETTEALGRPDVASLLTPAGEDQEVLRAAGKLQRAIERARRSAVKFLDSGTALAHTADVYTLLETLTDVLESALRTKPTADAITAVLDTLFVLARTKLNVHDAHTHGSPHAVLKRATGLLDIEIEDVAADKATYARCISGAFHNLAGMLYQAGKHSAAIRYLQDGCTLGRTALVMHAAVVTEDQEDPKLVEGWKQLEEQLWRRWELLGVCYSKIGDRKLAFESFMDCIKAFPYSLNGFAKHTHRATAATAFQASPAAVQLGTIVDRVTYLGTCELLLGPQTVSLVSLGLGDASIVGALLERQVQSLNDSRWKESTRSAIRAFLCAILEIYVETTMPVRRARTYLRCLEFAYHAGPESLANLCSPAEMGEEVEHLLSQKILGQDSHLSCFCAQYQASAHLWLALHSHRRADKEQNSVVSHHVEVACKILEPLAGLARTGEPSPKASKKPKQTAATSKRAVTRRPAPRKAVLSRDPLTVHPLSHHLLSLPQRKVVPTALEIPQKIAADTKRSTRFDDFDGFFGLLQLATRILGLLTHVLLKVHLLDITRRLCERSSDFVTDDYISASVELALEYMKLGKTKRATGLFTHTLNAVRSGKASADMSVTFYLRHAEVMALAEDIARSADLYSEALETAERLSDESKGMSTLERVQCRVGRLEKAAVAAHVFALIQHSREDLATSLEALLQSLRLWNRAVDTLARLNPPTSKLMEEDNPFDTSAMCDVLPNGNTAEQLAAPKVFPRAPSMGRLEWRVSEGLLSVLFALCEAYFIRGSPREAEYFAQQAYDLAQSLNAPAMAGHALAKKGELQLHQRLLKEAHDTFMQAAALLQNLPGKESADVQRLCGDYNQLSSQDKDAQQLYEEATRMLEELDQTFGVFDCNAICPRKSMEPATSTAKEILLPELLAAVLRQHIWLLRNNGSSYAKLLQRFLALPAGSRTKAQENALMAKLTLHEVYGRFRTDMFLSSLAESTIALPMGMSTDKAPALSPSTQDIIHTLDHAEHLFWLEFTLFSRRGDVPRVRDAVVSLAMIRALRTSLGKSGNHDPILVAGLLDVSTAITISREMLEAIQHKFPPFTLVDDLQWPRASRSGSPLSPAHHPGRLLTRPPRFDNSFGSELDVSDDEFDADEKLLKDYWESVRSKYQSQAPDISTLSASQMLGVPQNWTIVHISVTDDKSTLFVTRQHGGDAKPPLVFCVPLKGRRDDDDDEHLTFEDALREFGDIVKLSDEGTRGAVHIKDEPEARARWWKERTALDARMCDLLENIEFCWLGAFKTILSPRTNLTAAAISDLRGQFDKVFHRGLRFQDKKVKPRPVGTHKRLPSESQIPSKVALDDVLLECFSTLSPKCRDEELEDLVFFILDLYQFHGVPVAIAEVDIDQVVVDLRGVLEEHHARLAGRRRGAGPASAKIEDEHMFLILDKNVQGLPWESIPILRGKSISRIPSVDFLLDRVQLAGWLAHGAGSSVVDRASVDPHKGYCVLNPSGDLTRTEGRFRGWVADMETVGWQSVIGRAPSEQQFLDALKKKDLVVYFGHGGAEQYLRSHKIRNLPRCAATMLWGCSSGSLREMGDFDRVGTPYNYMLAGCPTLVANIWDVTDRDIDIFSQTVFDKLKLNAEGVRNWDAHGGSREGQTSLIAAVAQSRSSCKLKYLTGAAPVVYGIPFYL